MSDIRIRSSKSKKLKDFFKEVSLVDIDFRRDYKSVKGINLDGSTHNDIYRFYSIDVKNEVLKKLDEHFVRIQNHGIYIAKDVLETVDYISFNHSYGSIKLGKKVGPKRNLSFCTIFKAELDSSLIRTFIKYNLLNKESLKELKTHYTIWDRNNLGKKIFDILEQYLKTKDPDIVEIYLECF